jgi:hypothetical protein
MTHPERALGAMTVVEDAARVAQAGSWILAGTTHGSTQVRSLVPDSFEDYARIFHPAARKADERDAKAHDVLWREVRWREIAEANGKVVHPAMQWPSISDAAPGTQPGLWERVPRRDSLPPRLTGVLCESSPSSRAPKSTAGARFGRVTGTWSACDPTPRSHAWPCGTAP